MEDIVLAVYKEENYAGDSQLKLVRVFCDTVEASKHLNENPTHILKLVKIVEFNAD